MQGDFNLNPDFEIMDHTLYTTTSGNKIDYLMRHKVSNTYIYIQANQNGILSSCFLRNDEEFSKYLIKVPQFKRYDKDTLKFGDKFIYNYNNRHTILVVGVGQHGFYYCTEDSLCVWFADWNTLWYHYNHMDGTPARIKIKD